MGIEKQTCEKIRALYRAGYAVEEIAKFFGLHVGTIKVICLRV